MTGVALQEKRHSVRTMPLQFDDVEVLFAALTPLESALFPLSAPGVPFPTTCTAALPTLARCGQLGQFGVNQVVTGWKTHDVLQGPVHRHQGFLRMC